MMTWVGGATEQEEGKKKQKRKSLPLHSELIPKYLTVCRKTWVGAVEHEAIKNKKKPAAVTNGAAKSTCEKAPQLYSYSEDVVPKQRGAQSRKRLGRRIKQPVVAAVLAAMPMTTAVGTAPPPPRLAVSPSGAR